MGKEQWLTTEWVSDEVETQKRSWLDMVLERLRVRPYVVPLISTFIIAIIATIIMSSSPLGDVPPSYDYEVDTERMERPEKLNAKRSYWLSPR